MYVGIDSSMPRKTTLAFDTVEPMSMSSEGINMTSTVVADGVYPDRDQQLSRLCDGGHATTPQTRQ